MRQHPRGVKLTAHGAIDHPYTDHLRGTKNLIIHAGGGEGLLGGCVALSPTYERRYSKDTKNKLCMRPTTLGEA